MKEFFKEFKEFAMKGNIVDLAVAVVIGGAFGKIVTSLVNNIIMPLLGVIMGGNDLAGLNITVGNAVVTYGVFLQNIVDFLIIALAIFVAVKGIKKLEKLRGILYNNSRLEYALYYLKFNRQFVYGSSGLFIINGKP